MFLLVKKFDVYLIFYSRHSTPQELCQPRLSTYGIDLYLVRFNNQKSYFLTNFPILYS